MTKLEKAILAPLVYYDLLDRPLTAVETFKYLCALAPEISFFKVRQELKSSWPLNDRLRKKEGLYFLAGRQRLIKIRQKKLKLAQLKWKKLKRLGCFLALSPFLRLAAVTGSLTAYNTQTSSDFDLLIILKKNRLWLGRLLLTGLVGLLGRRRHGTLTQDRLCLNCYLTEEKLEITPKIKPRDWHAAQEYGRLTPLLEIESGLYKKFVASNLWLADFLKNYPWPNDLGAKRLRSGLFSSALRQALEWLLEGSLGERLEMATGRWQKKRIQHKRPPEKFLGGDQVFISDDCLMFHPQSKSDKLIREFNLKMAAYDDPNADQNK